MLPQKCLRLRTRNSLPVSRLMRFGPNPGATADDRGLYLYNPVTVPLAPAGEMPSVSVIGGYRKILTVVMPIF